MKRIPFYQTSEVLGKRRQRTCQTLCFKRPHLKPNQILGARKKFSANLRISVGGATASLEIIPPKISRAKPEKAENVKGKRSGTTSSTLGRENPGEQWW